MNHTVKVVKDLKSPLLMVLVQIAYAGNNVIASLAINDGISIRVFSAYRLIFGAAITIILVLIFESKKNIPKLTWRVLVMTFLCGLFGGSLFQNLFFTAIALVSATYANAVFNMVPVITFILSFLCGYEKLNLQTAAGKAKVMGTIIGVIGSMMLSFFKGVEINIWKNIHINLMDEKDNNQMRASDGKEWIGILSGVGCCFSFSIWLIIQGIAVTAFVNIVTAWCVQKRGPLYASLFNPLSLVLVAPTASLLLHEKLYLGRVLGAALIVCGLYMMLWGKSKDMKPPTDLVSSDTELSTTEVVVVSGNNNSHRVSNN